MTIDDEILMAYADGELDAEQRAKVEAALAQDPEARAAVERHRALRARIANAYAPTLDEPLPEALLAAVQRGGTKAPPAQVVDLAAARAKHETPKHETPKRFALPNWAAMAATLAIGVIAGQMIDLGGDRPLVASEGGTLVAKGALKAGLDTQLAAQGAGDGPVQVGLSFRNAQADYCRTFKVEGSMAGIACREDDGWAVRMAVAPDAATGGGYRMAGSDMPPAVLQAVDSMIAGEPLDAAGEAAAKAKGWRD